MTADPSRPRDRVLTKAPENGVDLSRFPMAPLQAGSVWYRSHSSVRGPWYFAFHAEGRFDLEAPSGTCYLANSVEAAARESIGPDLLEAGKVVDTFLRERSVSVLKLPEDVTAADLTADLTVFRISVGELAAAVSYDVSQAWAGMLHKASFGAVLYQPRFSGSTGRAIGLFGESGPRGDDWDIEPNPMSLHDVVQGMDAEIEVTILTPPKTKAQLQLVKVITSVSQLRQLP